MNICVLSPGLSLNKVFLKSVTHVKFLSLKYLLQVIMESLGLEFLPIVVIDHVASFLNIEDIFSCCAVSTKMREVFGNDSIWKRHCDVESINYLQRNVCRVEPRFEWDDDVLSKLPPVSRWKRNYMMQAHLFKNMRSSRYQKIDFELGPSNDVYSESNIKFYENDHLFVHTKHFNGEALLGEIWDVAETPFLHLPFNLNFDQFFDNFGCLDLFEIVNNRLVVGLCNLILIYDIALGSFSRIPLVNAFLFDMSEQGSKDIIKHDKNTFYRKYLFELTSFVKIIISDRKLIGSSNYTGLGCPSFHVWDVETGKKLDYVSIPVRNLYIVKVKFLSDENSQNIVVQVLAAKDRYSYHCFGYDLSKMAFSSFSVSVNYCDFLIYKSKRLFGAGQERLFVYSYETSEQLLVRKFTQQIIKDTMVAIGNLILFGTMDNIINVMDISTLDVINKVKLDFTLYRLRGICERFVVINSVNSEVWEIGRTSKKLFKLPASGSVIAVSKYCTKFAIQKENKIIILNFW